MRYSARCGRDTKEHRFRLTPPATEAVVAAFEERQGIELPEAYRAFITTAGASGAGPYYGLFPLEKWNDLFCETTGDGLLTEPAPTVVEKALFAVLDRRCVQQSRLEMLARDERDLVRRTATWVLTRW